MREQKNHKIGYNDKLYWDSGNWTFESDGVHKELAKLKNGSYVLIISTQRVKIITASQKSRSKRIKKLQGDKK